MKNFEELWNWLKSKRSFTTLGGRRKNEACVSGDNLEIDILKKGSIHRRSKDAVERDFKNYPSTNSGRPLGDTRYVYALIKEWNEHCRNNGCERRFDSGVALNGGTVQEWDVTDVVPVLPVISVTVIMSSYQSFGPCHASRLTVKRSGNGFSWGSKDAKGTQPLDAIRAYKSVSDDKGLVYKPVPAKLRSKVESVFDELAICYSTLQDDCKGISDRFPFSPSSLEIIITTANSIWKMNTTYNPADGHKLPWIVNELIHLAF